MSEVRDAAERVKKFLDSWEAFNRGTREGDFIHAFSGSRYHHELTPVDLQVLVDAVLVEDEDEPGTDWPTTASVVRRLNNGWELYDDDGTMRWYSETKPGFDDELPTEVEIALIRKIEGCQ